MSVPPRPVDTSSVAPPEPDDDFGQCECCDDKEGPFCEGCGCCAECCNCTDTDCDCDVCIDRREANRHDD